MIQIHGHSLNVERYGHGEAPAVVLLHHGLGSTKAWKAQIQPLVEHGYQVIVYDRWGYGASEPRSCFSMPYFAEDLADLEALLEHLALERVSLVGHSDGGTLALYYAAQQPQRVSAMVVVAAHIYVEPRMVVGIESIRQAFEQDERFRLGLHRIHGEKAEQVFWGWYHGWLKPEHLHWDMRPLLGQIACPVLVVQGMQDEHATPQHARDLAQALPHATLWLVEGVGHMLPQNIPQAFNRKVLDFLAEHSQRPGY